MGIAGLNYQLVQDVAKELYIRALKILPPDVKEALRNAYARETKPIARTILETILRSIEISDTQDMLVCQDTGLPIYIVKIGGRIAVDGSRLQAALAEGAKRATLEHPFRGSSLHPLTRENPQTSRAAAIWPARVMSPWPCCTTSRKPCSSATSCAAETPPTSM